MFGKGEVEGEEGVEEEGEGLCPMYVGTSVSIITTIDIIHIG